MRHRLADGGYLAEPLVDQSAEGVEAVGLDYHIETLAEVVQPGAGVHDVLVVRDLLDLRLAIVELVLDLPDDLLEQVLDGDDSLGPAILVDDDCDVDSSLLELGEQLFEGLRLRDEKWIAQHFLRQHGGIIRRVVQNLEQVSRVDEALDVVEVVAIHGEAAVSRLDHAVNDAGQRGRNFDGLDIDARHHDLAGDGRIQFHDAADHSHLELFEGLPLVVDGHVEVGRQRVGWRDGSRSSVAVRIGAHAVESQPHSADKRKSHDGRSRDREPVPVPQEDGERRARKDGGGNDDVLDDRETERCPHGKTVEHSKQGGPRGAWRDGLLESFKALRFSEAGLRAHREGVCGQGDRHEGERYEVATVGVQGSRLLVL